MIAKWMAQEAKARELAEHGVRYAWVVTEEYEVDWVTGESGKWVQNKDTPMSGPHDATADEVRKAWLNGQPFQLDYDGDDGPCCRGRIWCSDAKRAQESEACMAPLDDYGEGNYGATTLKYRDSNGKWEVM